MRNNVNSVWTVERIDRLVDLQKKRWSCAQIAADLGNGISRNAVIGKLHRMGISGGPAAMPEEERKRRAKEASDRKVAQRREARRAFREQAPRRPIEPTLRCEDVGALGISFADLEPYHCRYPYGEGSGVTFCGLLKMEGRSYCLSHARLTLTRDPTPTRKQSELYRRDRLAKHKQALLEAAE